MISDKKQIENFDKIGNLPEAWELSADHLLSASRILKKHRDNFNPSSLKVGEEIPDEGKILASELMLKGYAVECLLKAVWVKKGNLLAKDGKYIRIKGCGNHDLIQIAKVVSLEFEDKQIDILKRLSIYITSAGRYPISVDWNNVKIQRLFDGGKGIPTYWRIPTDDKLFEDIISIINAELNK